MRNLSALIALFICSSVHAQKQFKCKGQTENIPLSTLKTIYAELRKDITFKNDHPLGFCFDRAYLVSKKLDDKGFKSRQILIDDFVIAAYDVAHGYTAETYYVHVANVVKVDNEDFIVDPMYASGPMKMKDYLGLVLKNKNSTKWSIRPQDFFTGHEVRGKNECFYEEASLKEAKNNIESSHHSPKIPPEDCDIKPTREEAIEAFKQKNS